MSGLTLTDVHAAYGATPVLFGVDLEVALGEVVALMGRNGMGKTSTVKVICRMLAAQGRVTFDGHDLSRLPSHAVARLGIGLVPEGRRCFRDLTVSENLLAAARPGYWSLETVFALFPRLQERTDQRAASLSGGEQQMLAIGRALMTNPRLLVLDEATEGLAPIIRSEIWGSLRALKQERGLSILIIDKTLSELRRVCDRAVILERGKSVWSGAMGDLDDDITQRFIGV